MRKARAILAECDEDRTPNALATLQDVQLKMLAQNQEFLTKIAEMAVSSAGRTLGIRSTRGRKRLQNGRFVPKQLEFRKQCALCDQPSRRDVTIAMIEAHRAHGEAYANGTLPETSGDSSDGTQSGG